MSKLRRTIFSYYVEGSVLVILCSFAVGGCARSPVNADMTSFDPSQDQKVIVSYYRDQAMVLKEKAAALTESALRYEQLFGSQSDWVSGARQLSQYYAAAAQEQERLAEAHAEVARTGKQRRQ
jgi:hypothetical protein